VFISVRLAQRDGSQYTGVSKKDLDRISERMPFAKLFVNMISLALYKYKKQIMRLKQFHNE